MIGFTQIKRDRPQLVWCFLTLPRVLLLLLLSLAACSAQSPDVTNRLERLGNPMAADGKTGRALNVWDLQGFGGKLYIGGGSTVDNAGPINVWAYNPVTKSFEKEYTVPEEAIELFRVIDNYLYIPAADPRGNDSHKFYRRGQSKPWQVYLAPQIALGHVRDLIKTASGDLLLVGNHRQAQNPAFPATAITRDNGRSFQAAGVDHAPRFELNWFFSVFSYRGTIYAPSSLLRDDLNRMGIIAVYNPTRRRLELDQRLRTDEFIPSLQLGPQLGRQGPTIIYRLWQPVEYRGVLVYPIRSYSYDNATYKSGYLNSLGLYLKRRMGVTPTAVVFPDRQAIGEDLLVADGELYALTNTKVYVTEFWVRVYKTQNPQSSRDWQEVLRFKSPNKARSFERLKSAFYFGLGQDYGNPIAETGTILRVNPTTTKLSELRSQYMPLPCLLIS